nr:unnamed protein product [Callosobruchus chinensis]
MDAEESDSTALSSRSRHHSTNKMKVLVRSHAMREESPPPSQHDSPPHHKQPCIKLIPSPEPGGGTPDGGGGGGGTLSPVVVLSPSPSPGVLTQQQQQCLSPAGTLVPSSPASRGSPNGHLHPAGVEDHTEDDGELSNTKFANNTTTTKLPPMTNNNRYHHNQLYNHHYHQQYQQPPPPFPPKQPSQSTNYRGSPSVGGGGTRKPGVPSHNSCDNNNTATAVNNNNNNNVSGGSNNMLTVQRARGKLRQQSSSQGSFESSYNSPCLSRDSSSEQYTDTTGIDLEQFIPETLNRNSKDRALMLRIEQELVNLAKDRCKTHYKFPPMSSYQRMLVHRCAAYFGMDHNIESSGGKSVIVNKTKNTRIPETEFKELIREDIVFANDEPRRSILKRDSNSIEDYSFKSPDRSCSSENRRSKSFEEREEEYEKARRRIFNREHMHDGSSEDFGWSEMPWSSTESEYSSRFRLQPPDCHRRHFGKLIKVHSEDTAETLRPYVAKSYSFGGYGGSISVLSRGDSVMSTHSAGPRLLTKQDSSASSVSWRLSPSSSGYKSQSQMSESVTPSPTSTPHQGAAPQSGGGAGPLPEQPIEAEEVPAVMRKCDHVDSHIVWAVTDIHNVPLGSIIIDPETGKPLKNEDGTMYHYDPNNLPPSLVQTQSKSETPPPPPKQSPKENPTPSPKKSRQTKSSPTRKSTVTNSIISSSTSPSLPFTPPPQQLPPQVTMPPPLQRSFSYTDQQQQFASGGYTAYAPLENGVYAQSYLVYAPAPYGMHMAPQYDTRMEAGTGLPNDVTTYYVQDSGNGALPPPQAYQPGPPQAYWNHQQLACFYQNGQQSATTTQMVAPLSAAQQQPRFAGHPQAGYLPSNAGTYPTTSYVSPPSAAQQAAAAQQTPELVPVYPSHQPMQVVYHQNHQHPTAIYPQSQPQVIYTTPQPTAAPPIYPSPPGPPVPTSGAHMGMVPTAAAPPYPQGTPTPTSQSQQDAAMAAAYAQLAHGVQQMSIAGGAGHYQHATAMMMQQQQQHGKGSQMEYRPRPPSQQHFSSSKLPSNGKFLSRQSSVGNGGSSGGTNSPAATVVAIPPPAIPGYYKTPPDTPPAQGILPTHFAGFVPPHPGAGMFGMAPGQTPPVLFKQMGNIRISTPGTARSSRSPTPASDISHLDRQRMSFPPPNLFQGMPYVVPNDPRLIPTRSQPNVYKQAPSMNKHQNFNQSPDNRPHKNKKNK